MERLVARALMRDVAVADLVRRSFVVAPRLLGGALAALAILWVVPVAGACVAAQPSALHFYAAVLAFAAWSLLTTPLLAAMIARGGMRAAAGGRPAASATRALGLRDGVRALFASFVAGLATVAGTCAFVLPGLFVGAVWFVAGPAAAIEGEKALARSAELTRGKRFKLFAVAFVIAVIERAIVQLASFFVPDERAERVDVLTGIAVAAVLTALFSLVHASASAIAYAELRAAKEGVDLDVLATMTGAAAEAEVAAMSERAMGSFAESRERLAKLTGAREGDRTEAVALESVRQLEMVAAQRARVRRTVMRVAFIVMGAGFAAAAIFGLLARRERSARMSAAEEEIAAAWRAWEADAGGSKGPDTGDLDPARSMSEREASEAIGRKIASSVAAAEKAEQRPLALHLLAHHIDHLYGAGFGDAWIKLRDGASDDALLAALAPEIKLAGCDAAIASARAADKPAVAFAKSCPPDATALDTRRLRAGTTFGRAVFATLVAARAQQRRLHEDPAHDIVMLTLLGR